MGNEPLFFSFFGKNKFFQKIHKYLGFFDKIQIFWLILIFLEILQFLGFL